MSNTQPWTHLYRPRRRADFVGNEQAVEELEKWVRSWRKKPPKKLAVFLYGPPGIGKTSVAQVLAKEHNFELVEINASDTRNKGNIEETLGKSVKQNVTLFGQKRMILVDEMDGLSGQQDRGGVSAVSKIIDETTSPMILVANTIEENMEARFRSLLRKVKSIEFKPVDSASMIKRLEYIANDQGVDVHPDVLMDLAMKSRGDLRSATMDLETICRGRKQVTPDDLTVIDQRDRLDYTPNILNKIFTSRSLLEARKTINQSMISYDDLFEWIYENIPIVLDDPYERLHALMILAKADIYQRRAKSSNYRLLKYMFDLMTGGIAFSRKNSKGEGYKEQLNAAILGVGFTPSMISTIDVPEGIMVKPNSWLGKEKWAKLNTSLRGIGASWIYGKNVWLLPYYREPQAKWRFIRTYHSRRRMKSVTKQLAAKTHTSSARVRNEILPLLSHMIKNNETMYDEVSTWMLAPPDKKLDYLRYMSIKKRPRDFANLENYAKHKQREMTKMIDEKKKEKESDHANIERWLDDQKKNAVWKKR
ncbi:MAG: replication factor C large subunit [Candidatus Bathyarchaeota archaeon]|nr:replication factor C large subunit [Candidatus Bathyarchaeota archaeon]